MCDVAPDHPFRTHIAGNKQDIDDGNITVKVNGALVGAVLTYDAASGDILVSIAAADVKCPLSGGDGTIKVGNSRLGIALPFTICPC